MVPFSVINPHVSRRYPPRVQAQVAWENPVTRGLLFLFGGADRFKKGSTNIYQESVQGYLAADSGSTAAVPTIGQNGIGLAFNGSGASGTSEIQFLNGGVSPPTGMMHITPASWLFVARFVVGSTNQSLACHSSGVAHSQGWNINNSATVFGIAFQRSTTNVEIRGTQPSGGVDHVIVITHDGSNTAANGRIFMDGKLWSDTFINGVGTSTTAQAQTLYLGKSQQGPSDGFKGNIYLGAMWGRQLGDSVARELSSNPWQIVRQRKTPVQYFPPKAAVGSLVFSAGTTQ